MLPVSRDFTWEGRGLVRTYILYLDELSGHQACNCPMGFRMGPLPHLRKLRHPGLDHESVAFPQTYLDCIGGWVCVSPEAPPYTSNGGGSS